MTRTDQPSEDPLFDLNGQRKYLTGSEAERMLDTSLRHDRRTQLFCILLYRTGCRCSEALQLTPRRIDAETCRIVFRTLKRRRRSYRAVPVPRSFIDELLAFVGNAGIALDEPIFPWCRQTAWRRIHKLAAEAGIEGPQATVKGFRHFYGCHAIECGISEALLGRLLGHSDQRSTRVYTFVLGEEERTLIARMWR